MAHKKVIPAFFNSNKKQGLKQFQNFYRRHFNEAKTNLSAARLKKEHYKNTKEASYFYNKAFVKSPQITYSQNSNNKPYYNRASQQNNKSYNRNFQQNNKPYNRNFQNNNPYNRNFQQNKPYNRNFQGFASKLGEEAKEQFFKIFKKKFARKFKLKFKLKFIQQKGIVINEIPLRKRLEIFVRTFSSILLRFFYKNFFSLTLSQKGLNPKILLLQFVFSIRHILFRHFFFTRFRMYGKSKLKKVSSKGLAKYYNLFSTRKNKLLSRRSSFKLKREKKLKVSPLVPPLFR